MTRRTNRQQANNDNAPRGYTATTRPHTLPAPFLSLDRAIADGLCPTSLRQVADNNARRARREGDSRLLLQAANLENIAERLELLGFGRDERRAA